jgi:hypothetical protein
MDEITQKQLKRIVLRGILYGFFWFCVFSIPVSQDDDIYSILHYAVHKMFEEKPERPQKNIDATKVVDAISKAFAP